MLIKPDCIPCILKMAITSLRRLPLDEIRLQELYCQILEIPSLRGQRWDVTSPEVIEPIMQLMIDATGNPDPFGDLKATQNKRIMEIVPFLRQILNEASDPLHTAVKFAIFGNTIDLMMGDRPTDIENSIKERLKTPIHGKGYANFKRDLKKSRSLVYFGDNAGEIVFDKLLVEIIQKRYAIDVVFIVRSVPTLNDATLNEAQAVGIDEIATVVENDINGPLPGTILGRCSEKVKKLVQGADMIISKGGGNFDSLSEENTDIRKRTTFMLLSKCHPYCDFFGVGLHQPIIANLGHFPS